EGAFGLALFSRLPLYELPTSPYIEAHVQTAVMAKVSFGGQQVKFTLAHLMAPTSPRRARLRNRQLRSLAAQSADHDYEHVLFGDLNTTPWSPHYVLMEQQAGLTNAARGHGYSPTWPTGPIPVKIPIDHCLVSDGIA